MKNLRSNFDHINYKIVIKDRINYKYYQDGFRAPPYQ